MSKSSGSSGIGTLGVLGLLFITLKLTKVIDWSWWWVLSPYWGGIALAIIIVLIAFIFSEISQRNFRKRFKNK